MSYLQPPIDILLRSHFEPQLETATGVTRRRIQQVDRLLRDFLESDGPRILCSCNLTILDVEQEFEPDRVFARVMHADELLFALPLFLREVAPGTDPLLQRVLLRSIDALTGTLVHDDLIDQEDQMRTLWEIRVALDRAKTELNRPRRNKQRAARRAVEEEMARRRAAMRVRPNGPTVEAIAIYRDAWTSAGHEGTPRVSVSRSILPIVNDTDRHYFGLRAQADSSDQVGHLDGGMARFGRSYIGEPDVLAAELAQDAAVREADTLLITVPNQLGVDYNAHLLESVALHVAPAVGWRGAAGGTGS